MMERKSKMSKSHNKKRNVGIIYEQLLRYISVALVEGDKGAVKEASGILKRHFVPGTNLYREFRLFNALVKTTVDTETLAGRILSEAKSAALKFDAQGLRKEKSQLIKDINHTLDDSSFYYQRVDEYRSYATIQTLLNDWRKRDQTSLSRVVDYENKVMKWLITEKNEKPLDQHADRNVSRLSVRIMTEKFNKKYGAILKKGQAELIQEYVFCVGNGNPEKFANRLEELKRHALSELRKYEISCDNKILNEKMVHVKGVLQELDTSVVNDETLSKYLLVSKLKSELMETDNG